MATNPDYGTPGGRRTGAPILGWIIGIFAVIAVIWAIAAIWDRDEVGTDTAVIPEGAPGNVEGMTPLDESEVGAAGRVATGSDELASGSGEVGAETEVAAGNLSDVPAGAIVIDEDTNLEENPAQFVGKTVVVQGDLNEILAPRLYRVDSDGLIGGDEVTVIAQDASAAFNQGDYVRVVGDVRMMDIVGVESELGADIDDELFGADQRPVIFASSINRAERP